MDAVWWTRVSASPRTERSDGPLDGQPVVGVVLDPSRDECFTAARGHGARLNGERIRISECAELERALLVTGFPFDVRTAAANNPDQRKAQDGRAV